MRKITKILATLMSLLMLFSVTACADRTGTQNNGDKDKTVLYVANYDGGAGDNWLVPMAKAFEEKYKDRSFEEGKTGVRIQIDNDKTYAGNIDTFMAEDIHSVWFTCQNKYFDLVGKDVLLELTDIMTTSLSDVSDGKDTETIEDKLYDGSNNWLNVNGKYYGIPSFMTGGSGISYDRDLFFKKGLFIKDGGDGTTVTFTKNQAEFSVGIDGVRGTYDDGLPSSYDEFYALCDQMVLLGVTPFTWTGMYPHYFNEIVLGAYRAAQTAVEAQCDFSFDSGNETVRVVTNFNGNTPVVENVKITPETGYLMKQSYAMYLALDFANRVFANSGEYFTSSGASDHIGTQENFIYSSLENKPIAMIVEGGHWYNEAVINEVVTRSIADYGEAAENRNFAVMPIPFKQSGTVKEGEGKQQVTSSTGSSFCFINKNVESDPAKKELCELFVRFCHTDENNQLFTKESGLMRGLDYKVKTTEGMSSYGKSLNEFYESAIKVGAKKTDVIYNNNNSTLAFTITDSFNTTAGGGYKSVWKAFDKQNPVSVKDYFTGMAIAPQRWHDSFVPAI